MVTSIQEFKDYGLNAKQAEFAFNLHRRKDNAIETIIPYVEYLLGYNYQTKPKNFPDVKDIEITDETRKVLTWIYNRYLYYSLQEKMHSINGWITITEEPDKVMPHIRDNTVSWRHGGLGLSASFNQVCAFASWVVNYCLCLVLPGMKFTPDEINRLVIDTFDFSEIYFVLSATKNDGTLYRMSFDNQCVDIYRLIFPRH